MAIVLTCPRCDRKYSVGDAMAGRRVTCKGCGQEFPVPGGSKPGRSSSHDDDDDGGVIGFAPSPPVRSTYGTTPQSSSAPDDGFRPPPRAKARSSGSRSSGQARPWWAVQGPARYLVVVVGGVIAYLGLVGARAVLTDRGNTSQAQQAVALTREYAANLDELSGVIEDLAVGQSAEGIASKMADGKARMTNLMERMQALGGLTADEERYVKREAGPTMRKALIRIKTAFKKFEGLPALASQMAMMNASFDQQLAHWNGSASGSAASPSGAGGSVAAVAPPPKPIEVVIPADADAVTRSLLELKTHDHLKTLAAFKRLQETPSDHRANEVVQAILPFVAPEGQLQFRDEAVKVLAAWPTEEGIAALRKGVADGYILVRDESMKGLAHLKDAAAIESIIDRLELDPNIAPSALALYGPMVEAPLIARMTGGTTQFRGRVYGALGVIGGKETLQAMNALPPDDDPYVQLCAKMARDAINKRVGPLPEPPTAKAKASAPARGKAKR